MGHIIRFSRYLLQYLRSVIDPVLQNNAFSLHPENLILAMLSDDRSYIKELGLRKILKARKTNIHDHKSNDVSECQK